MLFKTPLERGTLVRRYKRFLADMILDDGTATTVHVPNPGAMLGLTEPGLPAWLSRSPDPKRKLPLTLEMIDLPDGISRIRCPESKIRFDFAKDPRMLPPGRTF